MLFSFWRNTGRASTEFIIESNVVETPVKANNEKKDASTSNNQATVNPTIK